MAPDGSGATAILHNRLRSLVQGYRIVVQNNSQDLLERFRGWPGDNPGYLIWFLPNDYDHVLDPQQLAQLANLTLIYQGEDGKVFQIRSSGK